MPTGLLALAPFLIASILIALIALLGIYLWRERRATRRGQPSSAEGALFIGLVILSVIAVLLFAAIALLSMAGPCLAAPAHGVGAGASGALRLPADPSAGTIGLSIGST